MLFLLCVARRIAAVCSKVLRVDQRGHDRFRHAIFGVLGKRLFVQGARRFAAAENWCVLWGCEQQVQTLAKQGAVDTNAAAQQSVGRRRLFWTNEHDLQSCWKLRWVGWKFTVLLSHVLTQIT